MPDHDLPLISVITACLNSADTIRSTIESILAQDYPRVEYIVIDGGSTDGTIDIINEFRSRIDIVVSEHDSGIANAFNKGVGYVHGELVGFMNADDIYVEGALDRIAQKYLQRDRKVDILIGDVINGTKGAAAYIVKGIGPEEADILTPFVCHQGMFARRELFSTVGLFDERFRFGMDFDWILRCLEGGAKFAVVRGAPIAVYSADGFSGQNALRSLLEFRRIALVHNRNKFRVKWYYSWKIGLAVLQEVLYKLGLKRFVIASKARVKKKYAPLRMDLMVKK